MSRSAVWRLIQQLRGLVFREMMEKQRAGHHVVPCGKGVGEHVEDEEANVGLPLSGPLIREAHRVRYENRDDHEQKRVGQYA